MELFKKAGKGLGLSLVGRREGTGVFVSDMVTLSCRMLAPALGRHNFPSCVQVPGGLAESTNEIRRGDQMLSVDGADLSGARQEEAVAAIRATGVGAVKIKFRRGVIE